MSIFEDDFYDLGITVGTTNPTPAQKNANYKESKERWFNAKDGFFCLPRSIREDSSLTNAEFRVLATLASFVFLQDQATPKLETLKKYTGMSEGTISKATTSLEKKGWIKKEQRPYTSVLYRFVLPEQYKKNMQQKPQQSKIQFND